MRCKACGFDDDTAREEDKFIRLFRNNREAGLIGRFPQHEGADVEEEVLLYACSNCGTVRIDSWRLR